VQFQDNNGREGDLLTDVNTFHQVSLNSVGLSQYRYAAASGRRECAVWTGKRLAGFWWL